MAILDPLYGTPLAVQLIPQVDHDFTKPLKLRDDQRSIGLLSVDNDDAPIQRPQSQESRAVCAALTAVHDREGTGQLGP